MTEVDEGRKRVRRDEDDEDPMAKFMRMVEEDAVKDEDQLLTTIRRRPTTSHNNSKKKDTHSSEDESHARHVSKHEAHEDAHQKSLLDEAAELRRQKATLSTGDIKKQQQEYSELLLLKEANQVQTNALQSNEEIATGMRYTESMTTTWRPPRYIAERSESENDEVRKKWHILIEGDHVPPPIKSFREMKLPACLLQAMSLKNITRPTPIQVQGLPALLSGRDIVGIAFTGSGKTLTFSVPLIMFALEEERNMPLEGGEGPVGLILCPSRELARQTYEIVDYYMQIIYKDLHVELRAALCIGGENNKEQIEMHRKRGLHCVVATPGRLNDHLKAQRLNMDICKYFVLDEGDRMLDMGFDEEVHGIINTFKHQRQTVLFSATMPAKFQDFAKKTLVNPIVINVGRAGSANLDVIQEVEYVKKEAKVVYLLECLQKTAPPVVIFCEKKQDVDEIHEYLESVRTVIAKCAQVMPGHADFIAQHCAAPRP
ncbi:DEAD/DEAH box helicase [archaeon]|nr:MAG: DEAD/DEAH box helicase [archaeon]